MEGSDVIYALCHTAFENYITALNAYEKVGLTVVQISTTDLEHKPAHWQSRILDFETNVDSLEFQIAPLVNYSYIREILPLNTICTTQS